MPILIRQEMSLHVDYVVQHPPISEFMRLNPAVQPMSWPGNSILLEDTSTQSRYI